MDLSRYAELFLAESQEHLQSINEALLELERAGFDSAVVDRFFRAVHTIKGMSATMGYQAVAQLSHDVESLLSEVREGSRALDADLLDVFFQAIDALDSAVAGCAAGNSDQLDLAAVLSLLEAAKANKGGWRAGDERRAAISRRTGEFPAVAIPRDATRVEVRLRRDAPLPGVRAFLILEKLRALGELASVYPPREEIQGESFDGLFITSVRTTHSRDALEKAVRSSGDVEYVRIGAEPGEPGAAPSGKTDESRVAAAAEKPQGAPGGAAGAERRGNKHVRVEQKRLDALMNLVGELVITRGRLMARAAQLSDADLDDALSSAGRQISELQNEIMESRMVPVWQVFDRFPRLVRDSARALGKKVDFVMEGREIELDRSLLDEIGDPIVHLLRNAVDHGIETMAERAATGKSESGRLVLSATRDREAVLVTVSDDGRGIDTDKILRKAKELKLVPEESHNLTEEQLFNLISTSGFSTADKVTDISGRGVGVDAVVTRVRSLGGSIQMRSARGEGTTVTVRLPLTVAIIRAMLARAGDETYALPITHVAETLEVDVGAFRTVRGREVAILRDEILPLIRLREVVQLPRVSDDRRQMVVLEVAAKRAGLIVDDLVGQQEIVVKQFDAVRAGLTLFSGATILGNGEPALIVDVGSII